MNAEERKLRELDALVAEQVFGYALDYEFVAELGAPCVPALRDQHDEWGLLPNYSTDMNDAWLVVERMDIHYALRLALYQKWNGPWLAVFGSDVHPNDDKEKQSDTAALAICHAALLAVQS